MGINAVKMPILVTDDLTVKDSRKSPFRNYYRAVT